MNPSSQAMVGTINRGVLVQTPVCNNTAVLKAAATDIFKVYGRIRILSLDIEAVTAFSNDATVPKWQFDASTPAVAAADISAASASVAQLAVGKRVVLVTTALNTAQAIDANPGISLQDAGTMDVGCYGGVGTLALVGGTAQTSGTCIITLCYVPMGPGAYAESLV